MILTVPNNDDSTWPSLGGQVCSFIETFLVFGPGDLRGQPVVLDREKRALLWKMYEVYPKDHEFAGRRRFRRCALSLRKGSAKTELAALIAAVELHPLGPVRCDGFNSNGEPVGVGVTDPYIPMVAYTAEQSDELAFYALRIILENSQIADDFDIGLERVMRISGDGKAVSLAAAPSARDGARTTFQVLDETHRWTNDRLKAAHRTMLANLPKRKLSDPWSLEVTTAYKPGEDSVAEGTMDYARFINDGKVDDPRLFFFHRQASDKHNLETVEGLRAAVIEASGPVAEWSDVDGIVEQWQDPSADRSFLERVWLNRTVRGTERAFSLDLWDQLVDDTFTVPKGATITLGFDGAKWHDSTAIVGTHIASGFQWLIGVWEKPVIAGDGWEVPFDEVDQTLDDAFKQWNVYRLYADPPYWQTAISFWSGKYGKERVIEWWTNRMHPTAWAVRSFNDAIIDRDLLHDGNTDFRRHVGNAVRKSLKVKDEEGKFLWTIYKETQQSPHKIDIVMAAILSWAAYKDALALGVGAKERSVYEKRGLVFA